MKIANTPGAIPLATAMDILDIVYGFMWDDNDGPNSADALSETLSEVWPHHEVEELTSAFWGRLNSAAKSIAWLLRQEDMSRHELLREMTKQHARLAELTDDAGRHDVRNADAWALLDTLETQARASIEASLVPPKD